MRAAPIPFHLLFASQLAASQRLLHLQQSGNVSEYFSSVFVCVCMCADRQHLPGGCPAPINFLPRRGSLPQLESLVVPDFIYLWEGSNCQ